MLCQLLIKSLLKIKKMKKSNKNSKARYHTLSLFILFATLIFTTGCEIQKDYEYVYGNPGGKINMSAWDFIQTTDSLSLFESAVELTGLQSFYSGADLRTFIVPRNSALRSYLKTNRYASVAAIPVATLSNIVKYHIVKEKVIFTDPALLQSDVPIPYDTENGQIMYLSHNTNYQGLINQGTKKSWTMITSNLEPTNGVIHVTADIVYLSL